MAKQYPIINWLGDGYLNPPWAGHNRSEGSITTIAVHHDAAIRPHSYDDKVRANGEAALHYQNLGPGLQYHYVISNLGDIFYIRPRTMWLHHSGNSVGNTQGIAVKLDGYFHAPHNQRPTREQYEALRQLLDWLCTQNPQFPADQGDVRPHRFYSATACCGDTLVPWVDSYRNSNGNPGIPDVPYDHPELQPATSPVPPSQPPVPAPVPPTDVAFRVFDLAGKQVGAYRLEQNAWNKYLSLNRQAKIVNQNGADVTGEFVLKYSPAPPTPEPPVVTPPEPEKPKDQDHMYDERISALENFVKSLTLLIGKVWSAVGDWLNQNKKEE